MTALRTEPLALGGLERRVMWVLWSAAEPLTVRGVLDRLGTGRPLAYTTLATVMNRLTHKGWLTRDEHTRPHRYAAPTSEADRRAAAMAAMVAAASDRSAVLQRFAAALPPRDLDDLQAGVAAAQAWRDVGPGSSGSSDAAAARAAGRG